MTEPNDPVPPSEFLPRPTEREIWRFMARHGRYEDLVEYLSERDTGWVTSVWDSFMESFIWYDTETEGLHRKLVAWLEEEYPEGYDSEVYVRHAREYPKTEYHAPLIARRENEDDEAQYRRVLFEAFLPKHGESVSNVNHVNHVNHVETPGEMIVTLLDDMKPPDTVAVAGDWHGNNRYSCAAIGWAAARGATVLFQVGDFDIRLDSVFLDELDIVADSCGVTVYWLRGNHDHHPILENLVLTHGIKPIPLRRNVIYLPDGYRWTWHERKFLVLGGAHSIDKPLLTPNVDWFPGETISREQADFAMAGAHADVMFTHDCPEGVFIPGLPNPALMPKQVQAELPFAYAHRALLRRVVDVVQPEMLFCGHYHTRHTDILHGEGYETQVHVLHCDCEPFEKNMAVFRVDTLELVV